MFIPTRSVIRSSQMKYDKVISDLIEQKEVLQKEIDSLKDLLRYWDEKKKGKCS